MIAAIAPATGGRIAAHLIRHYTTAQGIHAETIIGAAAALAGEFALRAVEPTLPDTGWVAGDNSNALLFEAESDANPTLWSIIRTAATKAGADVADLPDPAEVAVRVAASIGSSPFPPLGVPSENFPHEWSPNACVRFRGDILTLAEAHRLSGPDLARALAFAIAFMIAQAKEVLPPAVAATLALEIMIGVSRMAPMTAEV